MEQTKMRVFFTCETMEQLAVVWTIAKETGLQPDMVPVAPNKRANPHEILVRGKGEPKSMTALTKRAWKSILRTVTTRPEGETRGALVHSIGRTVGGSGKAARLIGLWVSSGYLVASEAPRAE